MLRAIGGTSARIAIPLPSVVLLCNRAASPYQVSVEKLGYSPLAGSASLVARHWLCNPGTIFSISFQPHLLVWDSSPLHFSELLRQNAMILARLNQCHASPRSEPSECVRTFSSGCDDWCKTFQSLSLRG